ncbi:FAD binding domain protein [Aspergillus bombycis]|uniref:FAD binding domain protein n=1 Tax=Aspergillus bombycis TaxID=109264 RepID=A0A1F8A0R1_9EURO|nr:FAD binding domain protein [Aspergillus bombycis]OGM44898.1 FAD binding domain protein [Aspergillus bombycis]
MLEKFDIDYVLLEKHSEIAPPVGASIGLFPNGLRILDQLGCYERITNLSIQQLKVGYMRDKKGDVLCGMHQMFKHLEKRHGYGLLFFDRQQLLEILHETIKHKDRVLLNKKVSSIDLIDGGVHVTTADGSVYTGTLVVGADGIHSNVRSLMRGLGDKLQPGYFSSKEEDSVPCYYRCSFGIAQHVPGWVAGEQNIVMGDGQSQLVVSGPDDRVYWFLFDRLPQAKYGKDIPRYTKEDEAEFVKQNYNLPITRKVTFGDVLDKRLSSTLTPLHEIVYQKWFFKRIITFGDSAHKPNPIGGQGANGAMESCAEFLNAILRKKQGHGGSLDNLSDQDIEDILRETQTNRYDRAQSIVRSAHDMQALNAYENPLVSTIANNLILPFVGDEFVLNQMGKTFVGAATVEELDVPRRSKVIPFSDELPAKPIDQSMSRLIRWGFIGSMGLVLFVTTKAFRLPFSSLGGWGESSSVIISWLGDSPRQEFLNKLVSVLSFPILDKDPSARLHLINFLPQLISPLLIYTIEGYRLGNQGSLLALPAIFTAGMQVQGIGRIAPLYAILSSLYAHESIPGRAVPREVAISLIPAVTLGFVLPTIMVFASTSNLEAWQHWVALWQFAPPLVSVMTAVLSAGFKRSRLIRDVPQEEGEAFEHYKTHDVPLLKQVYTYAVAVQSTVHIATMAYAWSHPNIAIGKAFFGLPNPFRAEWNITTISGQIATFFRYDAVTALAGYVGGNLYSIWDLRRLGYIQTRTAVKAALAVIAGQFMIGPGATWAALWSWREDAIAGLAK